MSKLGMSGVGYRLRDKIGKALKTRADAIKRALNEYNEAATSLNPPRERLSWEKVIAAVTLADLDALRDTRTDIRTLPWAQPARREAANLYFGIKRAEEEIVRLNVEIRRLITFMIDEHTDFYRAIGSNIILNPHLAYELSSRYQYRSKLHAVIARRLVLTSKLKGFTGTLLPGTREGREPLKDDAPLPSWATHILGLVETVMEVEEPESDEETLPRELEVDTDLLIQFVECLSTE